MNRDILTLTLIDTCSLVSLCSQSQRIQLESHGWECAVMMATVGSDGVS